MEHRESRELSADMATYLRIHTGLQIGQVLAAVRTEVEQVEHCVRHSCVLFVGCAETKRAAEEATVATDDRGGPTMPYSLIDWSAPRDDDGWMTVDSHTALCSDSCTVESISLKGNMFFTLFQCLNVFSRFFTSISASAAV